MFLLVKSADKYLVLSVSKYPLGSLDNNALPSQRLSRPTFDRLRKSQQGLSEFIQYFLFPLQSKCPPDKKAGLFDILIEFMLEYVRGAEVV